MIVMISLLPYSHQVGGKPLYSAVGTPGTDPNGLAACFKNGCAVIFMPEALQLILSYQQFSHQPIRKMSVHTVSTLLWKAKLYRAYQLGRYFPASVYKSVTQ